MQNGMWVALDNLGKYWVIEQSQYGLHLLNQGRHGQERLLFSDVIHDMRAKIGTQLYVKIETGIIVSPIIIDIFPVSGPVDVKSDMVVQRIESIPAPTSGQCLVTFEHLFSRKFVHLREQHGFWYISVPGGLPTELLGICDANGLNKQSSIPYLRGWRLSFLVGQNFRYQTNWAMTNPIREVLKLEDIRLYSKLHANAA